MFLLIDNYDSFTYNVYTLFAKLGIKLQVRKNDKGVVDGSFEGLILSPGPSNPENSGDTLNYIKKYAGKIPIFGVCLGLQAICYARGYEIRQAHKIMHGKRDTINVLKRVVLFNNIPDNFKAVRYHSLVAGAANNYVTAISHSDNEIMAFEDKKNMLFGVQFHPESFLSDFGAEIAINFINFCKEAHEVKVWEQEKAWILKYF